MMLSMDIIWLTAKLKERLYEHTKLLLASVYAVSRALGQLNRSRTSFSMDSLNKKINLIIIKTHGSGVHGQELLAHTLHTVFMCSNSFDILVRILHDGA